MAIVRRSKKRDAILRLMRTTKCHPSADWIYQQLKDEYPNLSLGTVYRNLNQLSEQRIIRRVGVIHGQERFDADTHPHAHFVCRSCRRVMDMELPEAVTETCVELDREYGFIAEECSLTVRGLCRDCRGLQAG